MLERLSKHTCNGKIPMIIVLFVLSQIIQYGRALVFNNLEHQSWCSYALQHKHKYCILDFKKKERKKREQAMGEKMVISSECFLFNLEQSMYLGERGRNIIVISKGCPLSRRS